MKKNTSGDEVKFNNFDNSNYALNDYSRIGKMRPAQNERYDSKEAHQMIEFLPVDGENCMSWQRRTAQAAYKLTEHSRYYHVYGTSKTWACHTTSRYCFICELCNFVDMLRTFINSLDELIPLSSLNWQVLTDAEGLSYRLTHADS